MRLSELRTGEKADIVKVLGHGGFRKRIVEMGFVRGQTVEVLQNAPLQDPVVYKVMGYEVSLRRHEAEMIEVTTEVNLQKVPEARRVVNVALIGNPNSGKTSLFNYASGAHDRVGNYSGVTVDAHEAHATMFGYEFNLTDLPGTYSLSCYSPEELYVRQYLAEQTPDVVINVVDASNLERNLYLTTELVDMNHRMVCALNMFDEFELRGDSLDIDALSTLFGMPMVPTSFKNGRGVKELFRAVIDVYEGQSPQARHLHINYGHELESGIAHIQQYLKADEHIRQRYSTRYLAIKLLENDSHVLQYVSQHLADENRPDDRRQLMAACAHAATRVEEETGADAETAIMDAKYGFVNGALKEAGYATGDNTEAYRATHMLDAIITNKFLGFPIFMLILFLMFEVTFSLGQYPADWLEALMGKLGWWVTKTMDEGPLKSMIADGVIGGVGSVLVFLPQILILYTFISFMEDSGYMARAAFIMDKLMHKIGLHGKSFIPLLMGYGCNVPAVLATRTVESRRSRLITMMVLPFMSCQARLPIYLMIVGTFFAAEYQSLVLISIYSAGIVLMAAVSWVLSHWVLKGDDTPFVMELPPYRFPTLKATLRHTWEKGHQYLKKMGGIILVASIIVWALSYFPHDPSLDRQQQQEHSVMGHIGKAVEPLFLPQGFNWKLDVSLIAGVGAKEIVASTMGVLYTGDDSFSEAESLADVSADSEKYRRLHNRMEADGMTPLSAYCFLLFILIYFPCIATIVAIKSETGTWRWAMAAALYTTALAWIVSCLVYQVGSIIA
ncbi:MAG: ferrous iron transport protein B [Prevotella sp.]|nr:ferrous iron transport protein B [Prevotella sp.]